MKKRVAEVQFNTWEKPYFFSIGDVVANKNDYVIVETELGREVGKILDFQEVEEDDLEAPLKPVVRVAELEDLKALKEHQSRNREAMKICKQLVRKYDLPMKLVDCGFSFDDTRLTFAFTSDTRVDFRELVKDLTRHFQKKIRLQQIGIRDTLKQVGGIGPCGRDLCCHRFLEELGNISTDLARDQQIEQRGSDRLSGTCGRLKCCLAYEAEGYKEASRKFPAIGSTIKTSQGRGRVVDWNILKHTVGVRIDEDTVIEHFLGCDRVGCPGCQAQDCVRKEQ